MDKEQERPATKTEKRFMVMLFAIFGVYIVTFLPGFLIKAFDDCAEYHNVRVITYVLNWASVWINPIIYIATQKRYLSLIHI